jgi:parallel beta-helix repeat protein
MMTMGGLAKKAVSNGVAAAFATMLALALAPSEAAAGACALSIPKCGCTINSPGNYVLTGASPMQSTGTCVDITASKVTLGGAVIKGPGPTTATFGIHIEPSANKVFLEDVEAEDFGQGIRIDGPNASTFLVLTGANNKGTVVNGANAFLIEEISESDNAVGIQVNPTATNFVMVLGEALGEAGVGIELNGVSGAFLSDSTAPENGSFGIWLRSASNNFISGFQAEDNGVAGVYLGCNPAGPNGTACPAGVPSSSGNSFMGSVYGSTNSQVTNTGNPLNQRFGIAVGLGNLHNHFLTITGTGNVDDDALDENPNCGNNRWFSNIFATTSPAKNTSFFCLN